MIDEFIDVMGIQDLASGAMTTVEVLGHRTLIARVGDAFYAADAHCPHMGGNLVHGTLEGTVITCPLHHSRFDLTDGHVVRWTDFTGLLETVGDALRHPRPLGIYAVRIDGDRVTVGSRLSKTEKE